MELPEMRPPCLQSGSELLATLDALHAEESLRQTYRLQVLARLDEMGHAAEVGARDTSELISVRHRVNRGDVKRDLQLAKDLAKYPTVSAALPDPYADPADLDLDLDLDLEDPAADADGESDGESDGEGASGPVVLNLGQAAAIIGALNKVPKTVPVEDLQVAEEQMVEAARHLSPADLGTLGQQVVDTLDTDGAEPAEDAAYQREKLWLKPADHGVKFGGYLAAEHAELFKTAIDRLAKPHKTVDGELDPRPRDKRHADALVTILEAAAGNPDATPGVPHLMVTIDFEDLKNATGQALGELIFGDNLSAAAVRRMACDAAILPIVLGSNSQALDVGTEQRFVNRAMRRALIKRDKGCVICKAPPPYCHAHHIIHWIDGGPTSIDNLALFCGGHHHAIHKGHYTVTITNGKPHVTRPAWADPTPPPRRIRLNPPGAATTAGSATTPGPATTPRPPDVPGAPTAPGSATTPRSATAPGSATWPQPAQQPAPQPVLVGQTASASDSGGILSWLTPAAAARLNPWGEDSNAAPGP